MVEYVRISQADRIWKNLI